MNKENLAYLNTGAASAEPDAPALEVCFRQVIAQNQDITLRTFLPNNAPLSAFHSMLDKMGEAANRLVIKRELDALLADQAREAATKSRLEINEVQTRLTDERQIAIERAKLEELVKQLSDEEGAIRDANVNSGRTAERSVKGARASKINALKSATQKQHELVDRLCREFEANRKNYLETLKAWDEGQQKFERDITALREALG